MNRRRPVAVLLAALILSGGIAGCIDRSAGGAGPFSGALSRLRSVGVPGDFDDTLLVSLAALACDLPSGTRDHEFAPLALRRISAAGHDLDPRAGALVLVLFSTSGSLCAQVANSSPTPAATGTTPFGDLVDLLAQESESTSFTSYLTAATGWTNVRLWSPQQGVLQVDGDPPVGTSDDQLAQAACNLALILQIEYAYPLGAIERALLAGDPDPIVKIASATQAEPLLDSTPTGLGSLVQQCFGG